MIAVLDYGIGNLRSAEKALQKVGGDARLVTSAEDAKGATAIVLPGVGAFGACMDALRSSGLDQVALDAIAAGTPFLGICVGLQMLYESSEESPGVAGLGVLPGTIKKMHAAAFDGHGQRPMQLVLPQMQWNTLQFLRPSPLFDGLDQPWMYFVHSFAAEITPDTAATCNYGTDVTAFIQRDNIWACQFHPEKSSANGLRLLENFVRLTER